VTIHGCADRASVQGSGSLEARALHGFETCADLLAFVRAHALQMLDEYEEWGGGFGEGGGAMPGGGEDDSAGDDGGAGGDDGGDGGGDGDGGGGSSPDHSDTNVQEAGVDEPDLVKTDGNRILAVARGSLHYIDTTGAAPELVGSLDIGTSWEPELFLVGNRVLLISRTDNYELSPSIQPEEWQGDNAYVEITQLLEIDISDPSDMKLLRTLNVGGGYVSARMVDSVARVVIRSNPVGLDIRSWWDFYYGDGGGETEPGEPPEPGPEPDPGEPEPDPGTGIDPDDGDEMLPRTPEEDAAKEAAREHNIAVLEASTPENWLPQYVLEDGAATSHGLLVACEQALRPGVESGLGVLSVITVDLGEELGLGEAVGVFSTGETVYASKDNLYVATHPWYAEMMGGGMGGGVDVDEGVPGGEEQEVDFRDEDAGFTSYVHKFDITDKEQANYVASGEVRGFLLSQWSMSEHDGDLRVATTDFAGWDAVEQESFVTVLRENEDEDMLEQIGQVGGLGKGEQIYAVRFMGEVGYVVTFRQVDPLYTVDLSDPTAPEVLGELKITGYSAYLHPVGEGLILGVGQDATEEGQTLGTQVSLFDVSDLANPARLHQFALGEGGSEVEYDHRAFLYWEPEKLAVIPVSSWTWDEVTQEETIFQGVLALNVDASDGITERGRIEHPQPGPDEYWGWGPRRSLVIGDALYTVSETGLMASTMDDLSELAWITF
jgi:hypothetical protein